MRPRVCLPCILAGVWMAGCVVSSLNPIYSEKDLVFEPALVGIWQVEEASWMFEKTGEHSYRVTWEEDDESAKFEAHVSRIGTQLFLDLYPEKPHPGEDLFMIPTHTFARLDLQGDSLAISFLDEEWMEKRIRNREILLAHALVEKRVILTGSTAELQAFARSYADDKAAFGAVLNLVRGERSDQSN